MGVTVCACRSIDHESDYPPVLTAVASPGAPFFVAGQSYEGGTLVIGVPVGESTFRGARTLPPGGLKRLKLQGVQRPRQ